MVVNVGKRIASSAEQFMRENKMEKEIQNYHWEFKLIQDDKTATTDQTIIITGLWDRCKRRSYFTL